MMNDFLASITSINAEEAGRLLEEAQADLNSYEFINYPENFDRNIYQSFLALGMEEPALEYSNSVQDLYFSPFDLELDDFEDKITRKIKHLNQRGVLNPLERE